MIDIFIAPLVLMVSLVLIHAWFGLEILKRGVIFADLAIGQIAALGVAVGFIYFSNEDRLLYGILFALVASMVISVAIKRVKSVEAFIGLLYAFGASSVMLLLTYSNEGFESFKALISRDILFITFDALYFSLVIYVVVGILVYWFRHILIQKDILFFALFSFVVAISVNLVGVLTVFVLLIAPAFMAINMNRGYITSVLIGILVTLLALFNSYQLDLPTGYSFVFLGSIFAIIFSLVNWDD